MAKYEGGCACGAVRYETDADPAMAGHCQCGKCQKLSGGGHTSFAAFPAAAVKITGKLNYWTYKADSGHVASRGHCPNCGSQVIGKPGSVKDMVGINLGTLDNPSKVSPQMVFYNAMGQPWDHLDDSLTKFPGMPPM